MGIKLIDLHRWSFQRQCPALGITSRIGRAAPGKVQFEFADRFGIFFSNRQGETRSQRCYFDPITPRCQIGFLLVNPPVRAYWIGMKRFPSALVVAL
ncbi:MAG TPA: hypothetical protein VG347_07700, partial [Verrucomicrobiae bacterium]|nr:hypothetical protein [Verrucomicrobiae bacterium]